MKPWRHESPVLLDNIMGRQAQRQPPKPSWLRRNLPRGGEYQSVRRLLRKNRLHTVCEEALCPNIWECFSRRTATFLLMGPACTRKCRFCAISHGRPEPPDAEEPARVADAVRDMKLDYVVVTSVTRDDLTDGGASLFAATIARIRAIHPGARVEVLIPDFGGDPLALSSVIGACPDVLNHNIETVPRLYPTARPRASYLRSLDLLKQSKQTHPGIPVKSGMMLGLGETAPEIEETLHDIAEAGCAILTLGQYLQPSKGHLPVDRFVHPDEFDAWQEVALEMGFTAVVSGPLVRSSYRAGELYYKVKKGERTGLL